jgi:hypothetical protein
LSARAAVVAERQHLFVKVGIVVVTNMPPSPVVSVLVP